MPRPSSIFTPRGKGDTQKLPDIGACALPDDMPLEPDSSDLFTPPDDGASTLDESPYEWINQPDQALEELSEISFRAPADLPPVTTASVEAAEPAAPTPTRSHRFAWLLVSGIVLLGGFAIARNQIDSISTRRLAASLASDDDRLQEKVKEQAAQLRVLNAKVQDLTAGNLEVRPVGRGQLATNGENRGGFRLAVEPDQAVVSVTPDLVQKSPVLFQNLPPGEYPVRIQAPGYVATTVNMQLSAGSIIDFGTVRLRRIAGTVKLTTEPSGAQYRLDGPNHVLVQGTTPAEIPQLPEGSYQLTLLQSGYPPVRNEVKVYQDETTPFHWTFGEGYVQVGANVFGAEIEVDGIPAGAAPRKLRLPSGRHEIVLKRDPWGAIRNTVTVTADKASALDAAFPILSLPITARLHDSDVWVNDTYYGRAPLTLTLAPGQYQVAVYHSEAPPQRKTVGEAGARGIVPLEFDQPGIAAMTLPPDKSPSDHYLAVFVDTETAKRLQEMGHYQAAYALLERTGQRLRAFRNAYPEFETMLVGQRDVELEDAMMKLKRVAMPRE